MFVGEVIAEQIREGACSVAPEERNETQDTT